jgi:amino acid permease
MALQMMFNVVYALGELAIMYPISGGFYTYSVRFIDPSWGFAMGWNYVFQWVSKDEANVRQQHIQSDISF